MRVVNYPKVTNRDVMYKTDANLTGNTYVFRGWKPGEHPTETFDKQDWVGCLHGCSLALILLQDPTRTQAAIEDDGIIHELIHIMHFGWETFTRWDETKGGELRQQIEKLQQNAIGAYDRLAEGNNTSIKAEEQAKPLFIDYIDRPKDRQYTQFYGRGIRQSEAEIQQEASRKFKVEFAPGLKRIYAGEPVHQPVLQRSGEEETRPSSIDGEAGRSDDVR